MPDHFGTPEGVPYRQFFAVRQTLECPHNMTGRVGLESIHKREWFVMVSILSPKFQDG